MKHFTLILLVSIILIGCQNKDKDSKQIPRTKNTLDTVTIVEKNTEKILDSSASVKSGSMHGLLLTSNALQIINKETGSTSEISFGKPFDQIIEIVNSTLQSKPKSIGINSECGAGPLKMATWNNGLTIVFQNKTSKSKTPETEWCFAGWFMGSNSENFPKITTMAGISIESTRADMESAYVITVSKTSLGYEFSTTSGLFGIFDGPDKQAKITNLWSGVSCNFR